MNSHWSKCSCHDRARKRITIDITGLEEGTNHDAVQKLLDGLTASELKALAMKVHGALYRRLEGPQPSATERFLRDYVPARGYPANTGPR